LRKVSREYTEGTGVRELTMFVLFAWAPNRQMMRTLTVWGLVSWLVLGVVGLWISARK
jgi:hypothetical protein